MSLRILVWHVHGPWLDAFVRGDHEYLLPTLPEGGPWGGGRRGRNWPASVHEVPVSGLSVTDVDLVVLQRPEELELARAVAGPHSRPGCAGGLRRAQHPARRRAGHPAPGCTTMFGWCGRVSRSIGRS